MAKFHGNLLKDSTLSLFNNASIIFPLVSQFDSKMPLVNFFLDTRYIMDMGSILGVTTLNLSHSLHSFWHALMHWFQVRRHNLFADRVQFFWDPHPCSAIPILQLFYLHLQWLNQIEIERISGPLRKKFDAVSGVPFYLKKSF